MNKYVIIVELGNKYRAYILFACEGIYDWQYIAELYKCSDTNPHQYCNVISNTHAMGMNHNDICRLDYQGDIHMHLAGYHGNGKRHWGHPKLYWTRQACCSDIQHIYKRK